MPPRVSSIDDELFREPVRKNERVGHLSTAQVEELYLRYLEGEKVGRLLEEFCIQAPANSFLRLLPAIDRKDLICPHCGSFAAQMRAARNRVSKNPSCIGCNHIYPLSRDHYCKCGGCVQQLVASLNGEGVEMRVSLDSLTPREKILLLAALTMVNHSEAESFSTNRHKHWHCRLAPTADYHEKCLKELFDRRIVLVSSDTLPEALNLYRTARELKILRWAPNVSIAGVSGVALDITSLMGLIYDGLRLEKSGLEPVLVGLVYELAEEELMEYLYYRVEKTSVTFNAHGAVRKAIKPLLSSSSVSNIFSFIWKAVAQADGAFKKKLVSYSAHAGNLIPSGIVKAAEYGESNKDRQEEYERPNYTKVCRISEVIYDLLLDDPDGAFKIPLPRYINEVMRPVLEGISTASEVKMPWPDLSVHEH